MPELPEVEVLRRELALALAGRAVVAAAAAAATQLYLTPREELPGRLVGATLEAPPLRRGKHLLVPLGRPHGDGGLLLVHLGMSGQLLLARRATAPGRHDHVRLELDDGQTLTLRDPRRFGRIGWLTAPDAHPRLAELGPDALDVTASDLATATRARRGPVKVALLDQRVLAGVGNIYADEALFRAGVRPTRPCPRVTRREWERIATAVRAVLHEAIAAGGSTLRDFVHLDATAGSYRGRHAVYGRAGEPCPTCAAPVVVRVLAQRSTHYCTRCQR